MDGKKALYYGAVAIAVFIGVSVLISVAWWFLSLVWAIATGIVSLAVFVGVVYALYKAGAWAFGDDASHAAGESLGRSRSSSASSTGSGSESRQDRLRRQYVEGQISEAEFERRIASELETEELDDIDRELADIDREIERER
ncbi:hypothetical protein CK500_01005 [Halorubrum salipaludis]|uniref:SHOCT domain-containing protein n=1 Tax=Halorubrum salipaludis TaxID=2032630 RepID=A0A2A2FKS2_9EURY|nr:MULTISPECIES: hypothetical protein [Halorubrum]PAU85277.1 hypothetical protein CK500_01005 [Halorubrum salipaludis]